MVGGWDNLVWFFGALVASALVLSQFLLPDLLLQCSIRGGCRSLVAITRSRVTPVGGGGAEEKACVSPQAETAPDAKLAGGGGGGLSRRQRKNCRKREKQQNRAEAKSSPNAKKGDLPPPCSTYDKLGMSHQQIYYWMYSYCLDLIQMRRLGFPLESELHSGCSVVYVDPDMIPSNDDFCYDDEDSGKAPPSGCELDANAREFVPGRKSLLREGDSSSPSSSTTSLNALAKEFVPSPPPPPPGTNVVCSTEEGEGGVGSAEARQCVRCGKTYRVDGKREKCRYHWGKIRYGETDIFDCCNQKVNESDACCTGRGHVWRGRLFQLPGMHGPFRDFVRTKSRRCVPRNGYHGVYALDGEMCYTTKGMELIRVSVVGIDGRPVYDTLVRPENPVVDLNTRFSGITDQDLKGKSVRSLRNVQNDLMGFISSSTILIGHGLENDFRALRLAHTLVVDTSALYPHYFGLPYRRSLKSLARSYLNQDIQTGNRGHDSFEDARASLELVLCKVKAEVASTVKKSNTTVTGISNPPFGFFSPSFGLSASISGSRHLRCALATNSKSRLKLEEDADQNYRLYY